MACEGCPHPWKCWPFCKYPLPSWASDNTRGDDEPESVKMERILVEQRKAAARRWPQD